MQLQQLNDIFVKKYTTRVYYIQFIYYCVCLKTKAVLPVFSIFLSMNSPGYRGIRSKNIFLRTITHLIHGFIDPFPVLKMHDCYSRSHKNFEQHSTHHSSDVSNYNVQIKTNQFKKILNIFSTILGQLQALIQIV